MRCTLSPFVIRCIVVFTSFCASCFAADELTVSVSSGDEITVEQFPATGKYLMLWFAPEYGLRENHRALAQQLADQNIEIWLSNIQESLFLPNSTHSIKQLTGKHVADLIEYAHESSNKKIIVAGDSYATLIALYGAHQWQQRQHEDSYLIGAILFSPYTYAYIPALGQAPEYMPIVSASNIPMMIYQAKHSATIGQFDLLVEKLRQHGNPVYTRLTPNVMSLFYQEPPTAEMKRQAEAIPANISKIIPLLEKHPVPRTPIALQQTSPIKSGIDTYLKEFDGDHSSFVIQLPDTDGLMINKQDFTGKVTLVNFWATWCPPCIEEIPSLNRLKNKMSDQPFELISINYAEDNKTIKDFLREVNVEFPVLLDHDGDFANSLGIITYPSTFVIDTHGKIKYGVNAAIEWDSPELIEKLEALIHETKR